MNQTSTANQALVCNCANQIYSIQMPSHFTTIEVNNFKQKFQNIKQNSSSCQKIICDFSKTCFMDSAGVVGLCNILRLSQQENITLDCSKLSPQVEMIFSLTGLDTVF